MTLRRRFPASFCGSELKEVGSPYTVLDVWLNLLVSRRQADTQISKAAESIQTLDVWMRLLTLELGG